MLVQRALMTAGQVPVKVVWTQITTCAVPCPPGADALAGSVRVCGDGGSVGLQGQNAAKQLSTFQAFNHALTCTARLLAGHTSTAEGHFP